MRYSRALGAVAAVAFSAAPVLAQETTWKIQSLYGTGNQVWDEIEAFADNVEAMTGGRLVLDIAPAGTLVGPMGTLEAVAAGVIDGHLSYPVLWSGIEPAFAPLGDLPGGFDNFYQWAEFHYEGGGLEMLRELYGEQGLYTIGVGTGGPESIPTNVALNSIEDFQGVKLRVPAGMSGSLAESLGASPVSLPFSEVFSALEKGVVDAADAGSMSYNESLGMHAHADYVLYRSPHGFGVLDFSVNQAKWDALPEDIKAVLETATKMFFYDVVARVNADDAAALPAVREKGVTIIDWSAEERLKYRQAAVKIWRQQAAKSEKAKKVIDAQIAYLEKIGLL